MEIDGTEHQEMVFPRVWTLRPWTEKESRLEPSSKRISVTGYVLQGL